jgi:hypothetical protein
MISCRQNIEELEMSIRSGSNASQLTPTIVEEIIRNQYSAFMAIATKVAAVHDQTTKAKDGFTKYQERFLGNQNRSVIDTSKDSFAQMATYLVPSLQTTNQTVSNGQTSLFGVQSQPLSVKPASSFGLNVPMSGSTLSSITPKRSNSLGTDSVKRVFQ